MGEMFNQLCRISFYEYFSRIAAVPRGSGNEKEISDFVISFAKENNLKWQQDKYNNIVITKPGSKGREKEKSVLLQCHLDMVCEKTAASNHDFLKEGINVLHDAQYLYAEDTSLGADNGVGISYILMILSNAEISHPPIEALFTTGEEVGMEGMSGLDANMVSSERMINLDGEEEGIFYTSCAGGSRYYFSRELKFGEVSSKEEAVTISISGLSGGHSGIDIDKGKGNAIILLARLLSILCEKFELKVSDFTGGTKTNAIPCNAEAVIVIPNSEIEECISEIRLFHEEIKKEFGANEPDIEINIVKADRKEETVNEVFDCKTTQSILSCLLLIPNGLISSSAYLENVTESSSNLGVVEINDKKITISGLIRANNNFKMEDLINRMERLAGIDNYDFSIGNSYPAWEYSPDSELRAKCMEVYEKLFKAKPELTSIHGGLECALMFTKHKDMDMISFGPNLFDVHTVNEKAEMESIIKVWDYLIKLLEEI